MGGGFANAGLLCGLVFGGWACVLLGAGFCWYGLWWIWFGFVWCFWEFGVGLVCADWFGLLLSVALCSLLVVFDCLLCLVGLVRLERALVFAGWWFVYLCVIARFGWVCVVFLVVWVVCSWWWVGLVLLLVGFRFADLFVVGFELLFGFVRDWWWGLCCCLGVLAGLVVSGRFRGLCCCLGVGGCCDLLRFSVLRGVGIIYFLSGCLVSGCGLVFCVLMVWMGLLDLGGCVGVCGWVGCWSVGLWVLTFGGWWFSCQFEFLGCYCACVVGLLRYVPLGWWFDDVGWCGVAGFGGHLLGIDGRGLVWWIPGCWLLTLTV